MTHITSHSISLAYSKMKLNFNDRDPLFIAFPDLSND